MRRTTSVVMIWAVLCVTFVGLAGAQSPTLKLGEKLVTRAQDLNSAIRATNLQVKKTLESYNYIVNGKAEDPRAEYKKLTKDLDKSLKSRDNVRAKATSMEEAAAKYFDSWEESLGGFSDPEMKAKSEKRLTDSRESYSKILEVGSTAGKEFDAFITKMNDQIRFLGQDLSPSALADLTGKATELNEQADALFSSISRTLSTSSEYAEALKPQ